MGKRGSMLLLVAMALLASADLAAAGSKPTSLCSFVYKCGEGVECVVGKGCVAQVREPVCCGARTAQCGACNAGVTVAEFCLHLKMKAMGGTGAKLPVGCTENPEDKCAACGPGVKCVDGECEKPASARPTVAPKTTGQPSEAGVSELLSDSANDQLVKMVKDNLPAFRDAIADPVLEGPCYRKCWRCGSGGSPGVFPVTVHLRAWRGVRCTVGVAAHRTPKKRFGRACPNVDTPLPAAARPRFRDACTARDLAWLCMLQPKMTDARCSDYSHEPFTGHSRDKPDGTEYKFKRFCITPIVQRKRGYWGAVAYCNSKGMVLAGQEQPAIAFQKVAAPPCPLAPSPMIAGQMHHERAWPA